MSEHLLDQIRRSKPVAPQALRVRVRALPAAEPRHRVFSTLSALTPRRLALAAPVLLAVVLLAAGALSVLPRDSADEQISAGASGTVTNQTELKAREAAPPAAQTLGSADSAAIAPTPGRLQRIDAEMRLRVEGLEELSTATKRAMRIAQSLGGYVASVQYDAPVEGVGGANLVLRVPTPRIQSAIAQLSALGTILGQRIGIEDLQGSADDLTDQIVDTQRRVAQLRRQLASTTLGEEERAVLQARLAEARRQLSDLQGALKSTRAEGALATVQVSLTTEAIAPAVKDDGPLDQVRDILAWEGIALLYVLVIVGPFVLLGLILWLVRRGARRRDENRLLEQH
jgi:Domain of unknown function (DUF4349)